MSVEPKPIRLSPVGKFVTVVVIVTLAIIVVVAVGHIMTPFVAAIVTAYLFNPLIGWLNRRTGIGRAAWIGVLYILIGALAYALIRSLGPMVGFQYRGLIAQIPQMRDQIELWIATNQYIEVAGIRIDLFALEVPLTSFFTELSNSLPSRVPDLVVTALERVLLFMAYLLVTFYLLLQAEQITAKMYSLVPAPYRAEIHGLGKQINNIFAGYIRGTLLLIPIMSVCTYIALKILGVRYALVIAIASGILEIIPLIGPWSATGIAVMVSLLQPTAPFGWNNTVLAIVVGVTYFVLRMAEDNFVIPQVVGHAVHLHPVLVLFGILAGGAMAGPFGLLIGIPTVAVAQLLLRYLYRKLVDAPDPLPPEIPEPPAPLPVPKKPAEVPLITRTLRKRRS